MATIERTLYMRTFNSTIYSQFVKSTEIINDASNFDRYNWDMK